MREKAKRAVFFCLVMVASAASGAAWTNPVKDRVAFT